MKPVLICFGTRPEWLKVKPLLKTFTSYKLLFTGQHKDLLADVNVDYRIEISSGVNRLDQVLISCLDQFPLGDFEYVLVHGDTVSAFGCAIAAYHRKQKVVHLEAGLRSYNLDHPYPEEGYRQMISRITTINLAPTQLAVKQLVQEKTSGRTFNVGNSVLDNLVEYSNQAHYGTKVLVTLHRRENLHWLAEWFNCINNLAKDFPDLEFIIPLHPNPDVQKHKHLLSSVKIVPPLPHAELLNIIAQSRLIITDSGGLQEEGSFFNKKVIVCRDTTERPEGIETGHLHLCKTPDKLPKLFRELLVDPEISVDCPYGDGNTSLRVANILEGNPVQVYGLRRSGTNFMEWSLVNNFEDLKYVNRYEICDNPIDQMFQKSNALKHNLPSLEYSQFCIIVYKEYDEWVTSMRREYGTGIDVSKEGYVNYLRAAKELDSNRTYIVEHKYLVENYVTVLTEIANKFKLTLSKEISKPLYRLNKDGANCSETNKKFQ